METTRQDVETIEQVVFDFPGLVPLLLIQSSEHVLLRNKIKCFLDLNKVWLHLFDCRDQIYSIKSIASLAYFVSIFLSFCISYMITIIIFNFFIHNQFNHNHWNVLKCDWCICCFILYLHSLKLWSDSVIRQLAVIRQLKQPVISPFSYIHLAMLEKVHAWVFHAWAPKNKFKSMKKHSRGGYKIFLNTFQIFLICLSHLHITFQVIFFSSRIKVGNPEPILPPLSMWPIRTQYLLYIAPWALLAI